MDLAGPFLMSQRGNWYILVEADYFGKWCEVYLVPIIDAPEIAKVFVKNWISHYRVLLKLHIDQGGNFRSNLFSEMCKQLKINKIRTTVFHPQSDAQWWKCQENTHNIFPRLLMNIKKTRPNIFYCSFWHTNLQFMRVLIIH